MEIEFRQATADDSFASLLRNVHMDPKTFLREIKKYSVVRPDSWQGPSARGGTKYDVSDKEEDASREDVPVPTASSFWTRLSSAAGSTTHGAAVVRLMQKQLLEHVENMPLDEIELMARRS